MIHSLRRFPPARPAASFTSPGSLEMLESRIAPATFTYTDIDGDDVVIKTSKGSNAELTAMGVLIFSDPNPANPRQLLEIDLSVGGAVFDGTSLSVMAKRSPVNGGDGRVNVGYIDAATSNGDVMFANEGVELNLGKVVIDGDLGQIDCGTATITALQSLDVLSMGRFGLTTQSPTNDSNASLVDGRIGSLRIRTDLVSVNLDTAQIASITIGGCLIGTTAGRIKAGGSIGAIRIGGDIEGGFEHLAGTITSTGSIRSVFIGGSILGGDNSISAPGGSSTGAILAAGNIGPGTIIGSLRGRPEISFGGAHSGVVSAEGNLGIVRIGGDLAGSSISSNGTDNSIDFSGAVRAGGSIASVSVGGSIRAGFDVSGLGDLLISGGIGAGKNIGSIFVGGSLVGEAVNLPESNVQILAGVADKVVKGRLASIGKIVIKGNVEYADIRGGVAVPGTGAVANFDAQIGPVTVGGNWIASNLTAGIVMAGGDDPALASRLGPVSIGGQVIGDPTAATFRFSAEEVTSLKIGGGVIPLQKGKRNDLANIPVAAAGDVFVVEVI